MNDAKNKDDLYEIGSKAAAIFINLDKQYNGKFKTW